MFRVTVATERPGQRAQHNQQAKPQDSGDLTVGFVRTVDRRLVHRTAVAEVFLTDMKPLAEYPTDRPPTGEYEFVAAAQLPLTHGYYNDHVQRRELFDPMVLLESCRQATIWGAHDLGVPLETSLIVNSFDLKMDDLAACEVGRKPAQLRMESYF